MLRSLLVMQVATVVLESMLYGVYLALFVIYCYLQLWRQDRIEFGRLWGSPTGTSTLAILALCTAQWILTVIRFFSAFLGSPNIDAISQYYLQHSPVQVAITDLPVITILVGDAVIIHRLWIIWNDNLYVTALAVLLWLGLLITFCVEIYASIAHSVAISTGWTTTSWSLTVTISIYFLIAWRTWRACQAIEGAKPLMSILAVLVESAAIYTYVPDQPSRLAITFNIEFSAWIIFFGVVFQRRSHLLVIAQQLTTPLIGIVNMLIHIRVARGRSLDLSRASVVLTSDVSVFAAGTLDMEYELENVAAYAPRTSK
ncbi:hypothetical protein GGX14DRAFT_592994 [Mycena pura]|uniref:Uncharacterized protein n=1 Tax=Mycena pura TaxID=153505 RepID=A0AAD6URZ3_9AGAR|nr:hypothetical protein GGX14DRAFT_592994 [Mycena pura]